MEPPPPKKKKRLRSSTWEFFVPAGDRETATCKICDAIIKTKGATTSGLIRHLQNKHRVDTTENDEEAITEHPGINVQEAISKLVGLDGIPLYTISNSTTLRLLFESSGCTNLPSSPNTVREYTLSYYRDVMTSYKHELGLLRDKGQKFSASIDEWTSCGNRRYLNLNLHVKDKFWNLGLLRIRGTFTSDACLELIKTRLGEFGLSHHDVCCLVTDGAAMMKKLGRISISTMQQQLCFSHALHLAVVDVIYKARTITGDPDEVGTEPVDNEEDLPEILENMESALEFEDVEETREVHENYAAVISKVRKLVKGFKYAKKVEALQTYTTESLCKSLLLTLDVKTRWNSMLNMLERVLLLRDEIKKALIDLREPEVLDEHDYGVIEQLVSALAPVRAAVNALCEREATLVSCDIALNFMFQKLSELDNDFSKELHSALLIRVNERRTIMSDIINYLHFGMGPSQNVIDSVFPTKSRLQLLTNLKDFSKIIPFNCSGDENIERSPLPAPLPASSASADMRISLEQELKELIKTGMSTRKPRSISETSDQVLARTIRREMTLFEDGGTRGSILEGIYQILLTIPPSSVEAERVFSLANNFCTKLRSRLGDNTLNALVFLKSYFRKQSNSF